MPRRNSSATPNIPCRHAILGSWRIRGGLAFAPDRPELFGYTRRHAAAAGRSDGRNGLPLIPRPGADGTLPPPSSAFRDELERLVAEARAWYLAALARQQQRTLREIHTRARRVTSFGCSLPQPTPAAARVEHQRLIAAATRWKSAVGAGQQDVEALTHRGNALVERYWGVVRRHHPAFHHPDAGWWAGPARPHRTVAPAGGGIGSGSDLAGWKPLPIEHDRRWSDPGALLSLVLDLSAAERAVIDEALRPPPPPVPPPADPATPPTALARFPPPPAAPAPAAPAAANPA